MNLKKASILLGLCLLLAGCGEKKDAVPAENTTTKSAETNLAREKDEKDAEEKEGTEEEETEENAPSALESEDEATRMEALMKESDYISLVEPGVGADNQAELRFLANYKGDLSLIKFEGPTDLQKNHQYLIFYKDDENGNIVPTSTKYPYAEVDGSNDTNLMKVQKRYDQKIEEEESTQASGNRGSEKKNKTTDQKPVDKTNDSKDNTEKSTDTNKKKEGANSATKKTN